MYKVNTDNTQANNLEGVSSTKHVLGVIMMDDLSTGDNLDRHIYFTAYS
jgi:hypothetical protein